MRKSPVFPPRCLLLAVLLCFGLLIPVATAQEEPVEETPTEASGDAPGPDPVHGDPPEVGEAVFEEPLIEPGALMAGRCMTGRNVGEFVEEGFLLKVTGRCRETDQVAAVVPPPVPELSVPDGEVRVETRVVSGPEHASFILGVRRQSDTGASYQLAFVPARGLAVLLKQPGGPGVPLAERSDLADLVAPDDWNSVAMRVQGPNLWVLLNDQPILSAVDPDYASGGVYVGLRRLGDPDDEAESAIVVRNLRVSRLID